MPTTLIVLAHPDRASFNGAWADASARALAAQGAQVLWSDLCALGFDPVEGPGHYGDPEPRFDALKMQEKAAKSGDLPPDVIGEIEKLKAAEQVIFHFPLWWFAPPAILKGWCELVLAHGALHDTAHRFDTGRLLGKRALFCVTTGSSAGESAPDGREGDARMLLWPLAQTLRYLGFTVLEPLLVHGVHGYHRGAAKAALEARLARVLADQSAVIAELPARKALGFNADADFDGDGRLKPDAPSHSAFIRRRAR